MALSRLVVRRYTTSSQAAQRLGESQEFLKMPELKVIKDVETRWWSTHACLGAVALPESRDRHAQGLSLIHI